MHRLTFLPHLASETRILFDSSTHEMGVSCCAQ
jgi:hypothetical protein